MVIEDSPVAMRALANLLETHSCIECVGSARNGQEGLRQIEQQGPDLVLVDMEMPGLDGLTLVELLRKRFPEMRLIVVSTHEGFAWRQLSETKGADAFVTKGRLDVELGGLLERFFGRGTGGIGRGNC